MMVFFAVVGDKLIVSCIWKEDIMMSMNLQ